MRYTFLAVLMGAGVALCAQSARISVRPVLLGTPVVLEQPLTGANGDSLVFSALRFYLGAFEWRAGGQVVYRDAAYHLVDLEEPASLHLSFPPAAPPAFDTLVFCIGVDSLTTMAGAMGGDLDPVKGMFWTWQSGYIHLKAEGKATGCPARGGNFEFHLGGYSAPFQTVQRVAVPIRRTGPVLLDFDLGPFFEAAQRAGTWRLMSPGKEATRLAGVLGKSFRCVAAGPPDARP